jgi:hypothetical protein
LSIRLFKQADDPYQYAYLWSMLKETMGFTGYGTPTKGRVMQISQQVDGCSCGFWASRYLVEFAFPREHGLPREVKQESMRSQRIATFMSIMTETLVVFKGESHVSVQLKNPDCQYLI